MDKTLRYLCAAYVFFLPVQFRAGYARFAPSDLCILICIVLGFWRIRLIRQTWSIFHWVLLGLFIVSTCTTAVRTGHLTTYIVVNKDFGFFLNLLAYAIITTIAVTWDDVRWLLRIFVWVTTLHSGISVAALLLIRILGNHSLSYFLYFDDRTAGMLVDPNAFGGLLIVALSIEVVTFFSKQPVVPGLPGFATIIILGLGVLFTLSRSTWIGFGAAALLAVAVRPRVAAAYASTAVVASLLIFITLGAGRLDSVMAIAHRPNTTQERLDQINAALPMFSESPVFGVGLGTFIERTGGILHDTTFWILTEFGLVGLTAFIGLIVFYFRRGFFAYRFVPEEQKQVVLGLVCGHLGMLAVSFGIEAFYQRHWWFIMALIASSYHLAQVPLKSTLSEAAFRELRRTGRTPRLSSFPNELYNWRTNAKQGIL